MSHKVADYFIKIDTNSDAWRSDTGGFSRIIEKRLEVCETGPEGEGEKEAYVWGIEAENGEKPEAFDTVLVALQKRLPGYGCSIKDPVTHFFVPEKDSSCVCTIL
jgi:hypothetical protein